MTKYLLRVHRWQIYAVFCFLQCFEKVLYTEQDHVQARHNLCVVYVERGELLRAEQCLTDVLMLAPREEYIRNHLSIVGTKISEQNIEHVSNLVPSKHNKENLEVLQTTRDLHSASGDKQQEVKSRPENIRL